MTGDGGGKFGEQFRPTVVYGENVVVRRLVFLACWSVAMPLSPLLKVMLTAIGREAQFEWILPLAFVLDVVFFLSCRLWGEDQLATFRESGFWIGLVQLCFGLFVLFLILVVAVFVLLTVLNLMHVEQSAGWPGYYSWAVTVVVTSGVVAPVLYFGVVPWFLVNLYEHRVACAAEEIARKARVARTTQRAENEVASEASSLVHVEGEESMGASDNVEQIVGWATGEAERRGTLPGGASLPAEIVQMHEHVMQMIGPLPAGGVWGTIIHSFEQRIVAEAHRRNLVKAREVAEELVGLVKAYREGYLGMQHLDAKRLEGEVRLEDAKLARDLAQVEAERRKYEKGSAAEWNAAAEAGPAAVEAQNRTFAARAESVVAASREYEQRVKEVKEIVTDPEMQTVVIETLRAAFRQTISGMV